VKTLGHILGSAARTDLLRALYYQPEPVGLRQLAVIAGVYPRSAELALAKLTDEKLVLREKTASRTFFSLDRSHPDAMVLGAVFNASERAATALRNRSLDQRARAVLPFIEEASRMIRRARKQSHVT